jgi:hypothetical protein
MIEVTCVCETKGIKRIVLRNQHLDLGLLGVSINLWKEG